MKKDLLNYCSSTSLRRLGVGWFALICWLLAYTTIAQTTSPSVDLTTHSPLSIPSGATFEWHSSLPISAINKMDTASVQVATPGIYYGVYNYGGTTACYSTPSQLKVVTNSCGTSTINLLASVDSSTLAPGWHVSIHTSAIPSSSNMLTNTNVTVPNSSTTYFVAYRSSDGCFTSSNSVIVTVSTTCSVSILANLDNASVQSGAGALSINVLSNDTRDGQAVTLSTVSAPTISATPSHGSVQVNSDGTISYTPTSGYVGTDSFVYQLCDKVLTSFCDTARVNITVSCPSIVAPTGVSASQTSICSGASTTLSANCASGTVSWFTDSSLSTSLSNTTVSPSANTTYYVACVSGTCKSASASVNIAVNTCSATILANLDNASIQSGAGALSINVLSNDTRNGQAVTLSTVSAPTISATPSHGSVQVNSDGTISYTPTSGYVGTDSFVYQLCDKVLTSFCDTARVNITVSCPSIVAPTGVSASQTSICSGASTTLSANCASGTVSWFTDSNLSTSLSNTTVSPSVNTTYYVACVSGTCKSTSASVNIAVNTCSATILANLDNASIQSGAGALSINVLSNDTRNGQAVTLSTVSAPTISTTPSHGSVQVNSDGTISYTPTSGYVGTDSFVYQLCDKVLTSFCDTARVNITVSCPSIVAPTGVSASQTSICSGASTTLSANCASGTVSWFTDSNLSTSLSNTTVSPSVNTTYYVACVSGTCKSTSANIVVLVSGTSLLPNLTSTSKTNACPSTVIDLSTITATNTPVGYSLTWHTGMPATLSNEISSISAVTSGSYYASFKNSGGCYGPTTLVSAYTTDCSSPLPPIPPVPATCSYATSPTNMVFNMSNEPSGLSKSYALIDMANAKIIQVNTSLPTFTNITTGVYYVVGIYYTGTIKNLEQGKQLSNVYIENLDGCLKYSEPLAVKVCGSCDYSTSPTNITFNGTASPTVGATTTYVLIDESTNTIAQLSSTTQFTNVQKGDYAVVAVFSSGTNSLAVGNNLAQELLKDSTCLSSSNALRFKVCAMPIANRDDAVVYSGEFLTIPVLNNDKNADNTVASLTKVSTPSITVNPSHGQITVNPDGTIKYSPTVGFIGLDSFVYSICDLTSATYCDTAMVSVQVLAPLNIKPIASNDIAVVLKGSQFTGNVLMNDYDPDGGTLTVSTIPVTAPSKGTVVLNPNGSYTYTPLAGATGYDSFCYKVCDNGTTSLCDTACVSINILESPLPINNKPIANDDNILVHGWSTVNINVKANDLDFEGNNTIGAPINVTNPSHGTLIANSNGFSYTPTNGYTGLDSFTYKICDNGTPSLCDTATVYINVTTQISGNNPPSAVDDAILVPQNIITVGNVSVNDSDIDNIPAQLSYTSVVQPTHGTLNLNTNGTFTYTPSSGFLGSDSFVYKVCDTNGGCDTATVYVSVYKNLDTDNDGISDANDLDDDNDGILDSVENSNSCSLASNVPDYLTDCDGDGIPNRIDLDSDNDGANDVIEANGTDSDGDGMADGVVSATGIPSSAGAGLTPPDTDNDTHANPYDLDSNNDGVFDLVEAGGLNPYLDADNNGIVDCLTNCDPDGDGILTPVDGLPNTWGDAFLPDLTPTTEINGLEFLNAGTAKDFVVNVFEVNNKPNLTGTTIGFRVAKLSGFTISYLTTSGTSSVFGGTSNSNSDWTFTENASFITVTAKPGVVIPPNGKKTVGFTATRKVGVPSNTSQNITVTIIYGSAGEERVDNNIVETKITAN